MADCFFHAGRPAVIRCKQCGKAICSQCRHITQYGIFCSDECAQRGEVFAKRVQELEARRPKKHPLAPVIRAVILIAALAVIYWVVRKYLLGR